MIKIEACSFDNDANYWNVVASYGNSNSNFVSSFVVELSEDATEIELVEYISEILNID